ncbi:LCP family protein [Saccharibacillus kuerlensis]|uniref:Transcriptional regulator n=1 Tax=Saccharibacillus kuerlensis TaxID=459527 RepID=A0ABQ2LB21_9BACL|nr:LCP family protein [Saccharibacillus kuerlensis]GGO08980.1 transcriptional regulator [Saccharibacillus kuerlensis]
MIRKKKHVLIWALVLIFASAGGYAVYYFSNLYNQVSNLQKVGDSSPFRNLPVTETIVAQEPPKWEGNEPVNILLMGVDGRDALGDDIPRSDTMLVASIDPVKKAINVFSIMRDTYVDIPGFGKQRINMAITRGPNTAMEAVGNLMGIPIQYYVYTDFEGFIKLVDSVGGIDFYVEKNMKYISAADGPQYDIDLKEGMQHLDGRMALQYVRFRHDLLSDFSRTSRQRDFLQAVGDKLKSTTSVMNLPDILEQVNPYIDTNLSVSDMWKLATVAYDSKMNGSEQIPPNSILKEETIGGAAVLTIRSEDKLKQFVQDTLNAGSEEAPAEDESDLLQTPFSTPSGPKTEADGLDENDQN